MPASPDRLAQVDAQLDALGADEASGRAQVRRLLEQRPTDLDALDAELSELTEGLDLAAIRPLRAHSEIPQAAREPAHSTEELSLDDLELPSEEQVAAPPPGSVAPPSRPASSMPQPAASRPAPSQPAPVGLDADSLFDEMGDADADQAMELSLDVMLGDEAAVADSDEAAGDAFGFEEAEDATGLFSADDLAAIQDEPSAPAATSSVDDDFDLLIDDGELADEAAPAEDAELDDEEADKKEAGFFKKLFG